MYILKAVNICCLFQKADQSTLSAASPALGIIILLNLDQSDKPDMLS